MARPPHSRLAVDILAQRVEVLTARVRVLEGELTDAQRELAGRQDKQEQTDALKADLVKMSADNTRLTARLDAALYAMVLMQSIIRHIPTGFSFNAAEQRWEKIEVDAVGDDLKLAV